jgi:hypothetical protein
MKTNMNPSSILPLLNILSEFFLLILITKNHKKSIQFLQPSQSEKNRERERERKEGM